MKHLNITVYGRVQGVFYRDHCRKCARTYGIKGFVKNMPDQSVYIEAEGKELNLNEFLKAIKRGNGHARVENYKALDGDFLSFSSFNIRY